MNAMIFAAGLGTRLAPITNTRPKALVEINGITLLEHNIIKLQDFGIEKIIINVHHFANMIISHIKSKNYDAEIIISDEREVLLDTGGGLAKASKYFDRDKDVLIHNVDVISSIDLHELYKQHSKDNSLATLCVSQRETSRYLLFNNKAELAGWTNKNTGETIISRESDNYNEYAFSGVQIISPELIELLSFEANTPQPIIPEYLRISKSSIIKPYIHSQEIWLDVGKHEAIPLAEKFLR